MTDLDWIFDAGFFGMRFYDMPNLLLCLLFVFINCRLMKVPRLAEIVLFGHCLLPMFLNGVVFSFSFMPDAFKYWHAFNAIRSGELGFFDALTGGNVEQAAALFTLMPFPLAVTPLSIGFINTFLYLVLFFWLFRKKVFTSLSMWFYLLYPSLALYTGMGLRDNFILVFMVVAIQWAREGRWLVLWFPLVLLFTIKFQNFFVLAPLLLAYTWFGIRHGGVSLGRGAITLSVGFIVFLIAAPIALPLVNYYRAAMFAEDGGDPSQVVLINGPSEFILEGITSGLYFFMKPFPWETSNFFQLIQSFENIAIVVVTFLIIRVAWRRAPRKLNFWLLFIIFALSIYGLVVFNYGTAARYRYPFITIFVLFVCSDCDVRSLFRPFAPAHWRIGRASQPQLAPSAIRSVEKETKAPDAIS
ncbi:hypothetical protein [uncultured Marinobacter sp.]|uniref:hypothetical protein n=1 Tax=uncultured Marinobacter sp. TaxID=187379 RepID=UPI00261885DC|nr:hypothetical protein [uncultured Marinobacter sp.]